MNPSGHPGNIMRGIVDHEKKSGSMSPMVQMEKLKFANHWYISHISDFGLEEKSLKEKKFFHFMQECFDLTKFKVNQLLGEVRKSKLFSDEVIYEAVNKLHESLENENIRLRKKRREDFTYLYNMLN